MCVLTEATALERPEGMGMPQVSMQGQLAGDTDGRAVESVLVVWSL
jgi:hypothetical protein